VSSPPEGRIHIDPARLNPQGFDALLQHHAFMIHLPEVLYYRVFP
jgi:hypothetical protein